jgi:hypothetical protein
LEQFAQFIADYLEFVIEVPLSGILHCQIFHPQRFFAKHDQSVGIIMCGVHALAAQFSPDQHATDFVSVRCMLASYPSTREAPAVDLALKLNVLAVCAVFAFVGAILLGAF